MIVDHWEMPSLREMFTALPRTPIVTMVSRFAFVVRSGLIAVHESPRSVDRKTRFAAASRMPGSFGDRIIGVSQLNRNVSPCAGAGVVFAAVGRMLFDSPVILLRRIMFPSCDSV